MRLGGVVSNTISYGGTAISTTSGGNAAQTLSETFSYTITDADGDTSTTTVTITVNGCNDAPIAVNDIQAVITGQPVIINGWLMIVILKITLTLRR